MLRSACAQSVAADIGGAVANRYSTWNSPLFSGFTDIDRQTELNDDDGSLSGLVNTVSVNQDPFLMLQSRRLNAPRM